MCWRGSVALKYRGRTAGSEHDNDLYAYLTLRYGDEGANGWSSSVHGKLAYDLDGGQNPSAFFPFASIDDTFHGPLTGRLYHAWANWHEEGAPIENVRIGRQWTETGDGFLFDGVHVTFAPSCYANAPCGSGPCSSDKNVRLSVFGGVPAHLFEDSPEGDWIVGAGISGNPWWGAEARADVVHVEDKNDFYGKPNPTIAYAEIRQRFGNACTGRAWYSQLNEEPRRWGVSFDTYAAPWDASFRGRFESQMLREKQTAYDIDPYFAILETLQPYWDLHLSASKGVGDHVIVEAGGDARRLWRESDQGTFNREFDRGFVTLSTVDWPSCGVGLYVTGEVWDSEGQRLKDVEGGLDWKPSRCWRFSAGTDYALWRTDLFATAERFDSRGYYIRVVHTPSELWRFDLSLRYEHDSLDDYWTVQAGVRRSF